VFWPFPNFALAVIVIVVECDRLNQATLLRILACASDTLRVLIRGTCADEWDASTVGEDRDTFAGFRAGALPTF